MGLKVELVLSPDFLGVIQGEKGDKGDQGDPGEPGEPGAGSARWSEWASASRTSNSVISSVNHLAIGTPVRYRAAEGTWRYGRVKSLATDAHTIAGYPCTTSDDEEFEFGTLEQVRGLTFVLPGNAVVADPASFVYYWQLAQAFIVESIWKVETAPTGAAILANIEVQGDDLHATEISISSTTEVSSAVDIQNYEIGLGETITVTFSQVGSTIPGGNSTLVTIVIITP